VDSADSPPAATPPKVLTVQAGQQVVVALLRWELQMDLGSVLSGLLGSLGGLMGGLGLG
jgi:hypothetical protein